MKSYKLILVVAMIWLVACSNQKHDSAHSEIRPTKLRLGISQDSAIKITKMEEWGSYEYKNFGKRALYELPNVKFSGLKYPFQAKLVFKNDSLEDFDLSLHPPDSLIHEQIARRQQSLISEDYFETLRIITPIFGPSYKSYHRVTSHNLLYDKTGDDYLTIWIDSSSTGLNKMYNLSYTASFGGAVDLPGIYISNPMLARLDSINRN